MWNIFKANRKDTCVSLFISFIYINISYRFYCWLWTYICLLGQHSVKSIITQTEAYNLLVKFLRQARNTFVRVESTGKFTATSLITGNFTATSLITGNFTATSLIIYTDFSIENGIWFFSCKSQTVFLIHS